MALAGAIGRVQHVEHWIILCLPSTCLITWHSQLSREVLHSAIIGVAMTFVHTQEHRWIHQKTHDICTSYMRPSRHSAVCNHMI